MPFKPFAHAALYSAAFVALTMGFATTKGSYAAIAPMIAIIAFILACISALIFSTLFFYARQHLSEPSYFLLHLVVGVLAGATITKGAYPYATEWHQFIYNPHTLLTTAASISAWFYVYTYTNPKEAAPPDSNSVKARHLKTLLVFWMCLAIIPYMEIAPIPEDPSCHNVFRGGRTRASPSVRAQFQIEHLSESEVNSFRLNMQDLYRNFALENGLSVKRNEYSDAKPITSLCNEKIIVSIGGVVFPGRHRFSIFEHINAKAWEPLISELICQAELLSDEKITFTGGGREEIPKPVFLTECE